MKSKLTFLFLYLICMSVHINGQNQNTITFSTTEDITVRVYKPIEKFHNLFNFPERFDLKPNINITYKIDVDSFCAIYCRFSDGTRVQLLLEGDKANNTEVIYDGDAVLFKGANAAGNQYLQSRRAMYYFSAIDSIFRKNLDNGINIEKIREEVEEVKKSTYGKDLAAMEAVGEISPHFRTLLQKTLDYACASVLDLCYLNRLRSIGYPAPPSSADSTLIIREMDRIFADPDMINEYTLMFPYSTFFSDYLAMKYRMLSRNEKIDLMKGYHPHTYGDKAYYLLAPEYLQPMLFGDSFVEQLENMNPYFDHDRMFAYLQEKYPDNEYVSIIGRMLKEKKAKEKEKAASEEEIVFLDNSRIKILEDLTKTEALKGNYLYVDLWASWCMPCIKEFQYNDDIAGLLKKYDKDIVKIYLSIDEEDKDELWRKHIDNYKLAGYNLRASEELHKHISNRLYDGKLVSIPRYLLIDPEGNIVVDRLPLPSRLKELEKVLDDKLGVDTK